MGLLHGPGDHGELLDVVEPAAIAEPVTRPRETDDLARLVEARAVLGHGDAEAVKLRGDGAAAHPELEAPAREEIGGGDLLRAAQRVVQRQEGDGGADANALRALGDDGNDHEAIGEEGKGAPEVQLGQPRHVEAQRVGESNDVEHLRVALGVRLPGRFRRLEEETESHGPSAYNIGPRSGRQRPSSVSRLRQRIRSFSSAVRLGSPCTQVTAEGCQGTKGQSLPSTTRSAPTSSRRKRSAFSLPTTES